MKALEIVQKIDEGYERVSREEKAREYIGASVVGHACDAALAFNLRGFPNEEPEPFLQRIFRLGHMLEDEVVKDLKERANVRVWEVDGLTGEQHACEEMGGHIVCHMDGHIQLDDASDEVMVLEIKSMNDASWTKFARDGVRYSHPQYFAQLQMMMGMSGFERAFFIAVNKNNSRYHAEIVEADPFEYAFLKERIRRVLNGEAAKIATDETDWRCRGCFKRGVCWGGRDVPRRCQTCSHAVPTADGWWHCDKHDRTCPAEACAAWEAYHPKERV